jgi:hypothetical protein
MEIQSDQRRVWDIDKRLESLKGCAVRVRAELVLPKGWHGKPLACPIDGGNLVLPDGTRVDRDPIYVEGILTGFRRSIAVVQVELGEPPIGGTADGRISFRGRTAVFLRGPATVQLAHPFTVERIPIHPQAYWEHLRRIDGQFELKFE